MERLLRRQGAVESAVIFEARPFAAGAQVERLCNIPRRLRSGGAENPGGENSIDY